MSLQRCISILYIIIHIVPDLIKFIAKQLKVMQHCTRREDVARRLKLESARLRQSGESSRECYVTRRS